MKMFQVSPEETKTLLSLLNSCLNLEGDVVELGCFEGDSSVGFQKILEKTKHKLYLYDSFAGLPEKSASDRSVAGDAFQAGAMLASKSALIKRFKRANLKLPIIKKAFFEDLSPSDLPDKIAFGFLDGDLYDSIKVSLKLCVPKMVKGGILVVHDYNNPELPGSSRAVDEFLKTHKVRFSQKMTLAILQF